MAGIDGSGNGTIVLGPPSNAEFGGRMAIGGGIVNIVSGRPGPSEEHA